MTKRRWKDIFRRLLCIAAALACLTPPVAAAGQTRAYAATSSSIQAEIDDLNDKKDEIQGRMDALQAQIDGLDGEKSTTLDKKEMLDKKNQAAQEELEVIQEQIDIIDGLLENIQTDLSEARDNEQYQRTLWLERLRTMEEGSDVSYMEVLFQATDFADLLTRIDLVSEVMSYDEQLEQQYIAARERVEGLEAQAEEMYAKNDANRDELERKQAQLESDIAAACQLIASMEDNIDEYTAVLAQEEAAQEEISALIVQKEKELAAARAAEEAARTGGIGVGTSASGAWMIWPTYTKSLSSPFGYRNHPTLGRWIKHAGVDIKSAWGTEIWAAAGGTVICAGWNGGYGNCVMINHGNGYTTVYGHMSRIAVSYGQTVTQGQVIGYVGSTGNSTGPHLHFEIRASATAMPIDPKSFLYLT